MTVIASLILTGIELAGEVYRRKSGEEPRQTHRTMGAEATLEELKDILARTIDQGRDVTPEEAEFWKQRIARDRAALRAIAAKNDNPSDGDEWR